MAKKVNLSPSQLKKLNQFQERNSTDGALAKRKSDSDSAKEEARLKF